MARRTSRAIPMLDCWMPYPVQYATNAASTEPRVADDEAGNGQKGRAIAGYVSPAFFETE